MAQPHYFILGSVELHVVMGGLRLYRRENCLLIPLWKDEGDVVHVCRKLETHGEEKNQDGIDE